MIKILSSNLLTSSLKEFSLRSWSLSSFLSQAIKNWIWLFLLVKVVFKLRISSMRAASIKLAKFLTLLILSSVSSIKRVRLDNTFSYLCWLFSVNWPFRVDVSSFNLWISSFFSFLIFSSLKFNAPSMVSLLLIKDLNSEFSLCNFSWISLLYFLRLSISLRWASFAACLYSIPSLDALCLNSSFLFRRSSLDFFSWSTSLFKFFIKREDWSC